VSGGLADFEGNAPVDHAWKRMPEFSAVWAYTPNVACAIPRTCALAWAWDRSTPARRDRLWLIAAFAVMLLTLLGAAGEVLGYDRFLKSNTAKRRTHSLFRQGCMLAACYTCSRSPSSGCVLANSTNSCSD